MRNKNIIFQLIIFNLITAKATAWLYFPRYTVLQVTMAIVMPFEHPVYKLNMNMGIQCNFGLPWNFTEFTNPLHWAQRDLQEHASNDTRFKRDLSAGEFYDKLEVLAELGGYHSTCIMKSVCEMAQHSFHHDDQDNILTMVMHFALTPSLHDSFEDHEHVSASRFRRAERLGRRGMCEAAYELCPRSPIADISYLDHDS